MNAQKDPRQARKLAKQQQHLRRVARTNPDALRGRERAMIEWDVEFDNFEETPKLSQRDSRESDFISVYDE